MRKDHNTKRGAGVRPSPTFTPPLSGAQAEHSSTADEGSFAGIEQDRLYTTRQAAVLTDMTESFYEARRAKELPPRFLRLGRCVKYLGADLIAFLKGTNQSKSTGGDHE